jgi:hypothetical protein
MPYRQWRNVGGMLISSKGRPGVFFYIAVTSPLIALTAKTKVTSKLLKGYTKERYFYIKYLRNKLNFSHTRARTKL